jgi:hypothetical protein
MQNSEKEVVLANLNHVLWAACRRNQTSSEGQVEGGVVRGYFTYCFCKILRRTGTDVKCNDLYAFLPGCLKEIGASQVPELEGKEKSLAEIIFTSL